MVLGQPGVDAEGASRLARLARGLRRPWVLVAVLAVNLGGIVYGFYYYIPQFRATPVWLWPLLPDSPFAVLLLSAALVLVLAGRSKPWLNLLGAAAMIKVGIWTAVVLAWFPEHFSFSYLPSGLDCSGTGFDFRCADLNTWLFYLHLGMAAETLLVADLLPERPRVWAALAGAFLLVDLVDYAFPADFTGRGCDGIFPHTVPCDHLGATALVTMGLSLLAFGALWLASPHPFNPVAASTTPPAPPRL